RRSLSQHLLAIEERKRNDAALVAKLIEDWLQAHASSNNETQSAQMKPIIEGLLAVAKQSNGVDRRRLSSGEFISNLLTQMPGEEIHVRNLLAKNGSPNFGQLMQNPQLDKTIFFDLLKTTIGDQFKDGQLSLDQLVVLFQQLAALGFTDEERAE